MTDAVRRHDVDRRGFASDNYAGVHPEVLAAIALANGGHQPAYGGDVYTEHLTRLFRRHFGDAATVFPVFSGTGANVVALAAMTGRWGAVITTEDAHINGDEGGAPERIGGVKLIAAPSPDGKLTPEFIEHQAQHLGDVHRAQPQVVSVTQSTELGSCYTPEELAAICDRAHHHGMTVHLDGARIANAAATLNLPLRAFTTDVGVDVVSFGGTKNGLLAGEAIVVLNPDAVHGAQYLRKMTAQLASKMRFVSVQFEALLAGDLWLRNATRANAAAAALHAAVAQIPGLTVLYPVQANAVFAQLPAAVHQRLSRDFAFYTWNGRDDQVRWMTSFDTTDADVDAFTAAIGTEMARWDEHG